MRSMQSFTRSEDDDSFSRRQPATIIALAAARDTQEDQKYCTALVIDTSKTHLSRHGWSTLQFWTGDVRQWHCGDGIIAVCRVTDAVIHFLNLLPLA